VRIEVGAWMVGMLMLGASGWAAAETAADSTTIAGHLGASEQEADEGYFALGSDTMLMVKPDSALHQWLRARSGQQVRLTIEVDPGTR